MHSWHRTVFSISFYWITVCYWSLKLRLALANPSPQSVPHRMPLGSLHQRLTCSVSPPVLSLHPACSLRCLNQSFYNCFHQLWNVIYETVFHLKWTELVWYNLLITKSYIFSCWLRLVSSVKLGWCNNSITPFFRLQKGKELFFCPHSLQSYPEFSSLVPRASLRYCPTLPCSLPIYVRHIWFFYVSKDWYGGSLMNVSINPPPTLLSRNIGC